MTRLLAIIEVKANGAGGPTINQFNGWLDELIAEARFHGSELALKVYEVEDEEGPE